MTLTRSTPGRRLRWLLGAAAAIAITAQLAIAAPVVPIVLVLVGAGIVLAVGSTWHGLLAVMFATVLLPIGFSVRVGGISVSIGRLLLLLLVVGWFASLRRPDRPFVPRRSPFDGPIVFLLGAMVFSALVNLPLMSSVGVFGVVRKLGLFGIDYFVLFWIALSVLTTEERVRRLLRIFAGLIVFTAVLGLVEHTTGKNVFQQLAPLLPQQLGRQVVAAAQGFIPTRGLINRARATFEQPLGFGTMLVMALPFAATFALVARERAARLAGAIGACRIGSAILLTAGRSIYALAALTFLTMIIFLPDRRTRVAAASIGLLIVALFLVQSDVRRTMLTFVSANRGDALEGSIQSRVDDYGPVLTLLSDRPLAGYGPRSFAPDALQESGLLTGGSNIVLDNTYLGTLAETGIVGLMSLTALLAVVYGSAWRVVRASKTRDQYLVRLALVVSVQNWILMGLAADTYQFNAPPRVFSLVMAAVAALRIDAGWRAPTIGEPSGEPEGAITTPPDAQPEPVMAR
ncbi:MAG: O-antigen ligase family protein [Microthrixaceae bacterium]